MKTTQFERLTFFSFLLLALLVDGSLSFAQSESDASEEKLEQNLSTQFFLDQSNKRRQHFSFNEYEHLFSGAAAFLIGNIGYVVSDSPVLKLAYTGIQTIGIINIGQGIYKMNAPSLEESFSNILTDQKTVRYSKKDLANNLLHIFAQESRGKRLSLFYGSSALAVQYSLNAFVYDSPNKLKSIYLFLGGVNAIIAVYTSMYKSDYERHYYGQGWDLNPFAVTSNHGDVNYGLALRIPLP